MKAKVFIDEWERVGAEDATAIFETMNTKILDLPRIPSVGEHFNYISKKLSIESTVKDVETVFVEQDESVEFYIVLEDCYILEYFNE